METREQVFDKLSEICISIGNIISKAANDCNLLTKNELMNLCSVHDNASELVLNYRQEQDTKVTVENSIPLDLDERKQFIAGREYRYTFVDIDHIRYKRKIKITNVFKDWYGDALVEVLDQTYKVKWNEKENYHWFLFHDSLITSRSLVEEDEY